MYSKCVVANSKQARDLASVVKFRAELATVPAVPIEDAAELLELSVRTLYRRRGEFEHKRQKRHLYFTLRSIKEHIEIEQYNPTLRFDITISDVFDISDDPPVDNRIRRA
jgi:hypothetical protein